MKPNEDYQYFLIFNHGRIFLDYKYRVKTLARIEKLIELNMTQSDYVIFSAEKRKVTTIVKFGLVNKDLIAHLKYKCYREAFGMTWIKFGTFTTNNRELKSLSYGLLSQFIIK